MSVTLFITSSELNDEDIHELALNLSRTLEQEADIRTELAEGSRKAGTKGGGITLGVLILNFLTGGAAIAMFSVLKSYFERNSSIEMEFQRADGNKLKIKAENVRSDQIEHTMESARDFFGVA